MLIPQRLHPAYSVAATDTFEGQRRPIFKCQCRSVRFFDLSQQVLRCANRTLSNNRTGLLRDCEPVAHRICDAFTIQNDRAGAADDVSHLYLLPWGKPDATGLFPTPPASPAASRNSSTSQLRRYTSGSSILPLEVRAIQNILMPLERLHDGRPGGNDKRNKQNATDQHVFNPLNHCIEDCAATVVNGFWVSGSNVIILGRCDIFAARRADAATYVGKTGRLGGCTQT